jgi:glutaredoxin
MGFSKNFDSTLEHPRTNGVVVYTTSGCTKCDMLKEWLTNKNTSFEEKNLEDSDVMTDLVMRNFVVMSAPALEINGKMYTNNTIFENDGLIKSKFSEVFEGL